MEAAPSLTLEQQLEPLVPRFRKWLFEESKFKTVAPLFADLFPENLVDFTVALTDLLPCRPHIRVHYERWNCLLTDAPKFVSRSEAEAFVRGLVPNAPDIVFQRLVAAVPDEALKDIRMYDWYHLTHYLMYFLALVLPEPTKK